MQTIRRAAYRERKGKGCWRESLKCKIFLFWHQVQWTFSVILKLDTAHRGPCKEIWIPKICLQHHVLIIGSTTSKPRKEFIGFAFILTTYCCFIRIITFRGDVTDTSAITYALIAGLPPEHRPGWKRLFKRPTRRMEACTEHQHHRIRPQPPLCGVFSAGMNFNLLHAWGWAISGGPSCHVVLVFCFNNIDSGTLLSR